MRVDGNAIARELERALVDNFKGVGEGQTVLTVFVLVEDLATEKFISVKRAFAKRVGVALDLISLPSDTTTTALIERIERAVRQSQGIVVQLPLPSHVAREEIRNAIPLSHDVDLISDAAQELFERSDSPILPPVVGAIKEIVDHHRIVLRGRNVVVVGEGRLVGTPAALWARQEGAHVVSVNSDTSDLKERVGAADILILGAGVPGLITPSMIKENVVIFDAGTSEASGKLSGDADPACETKAAIFTPVPGGIGPITVAILFKNLYTLSAERAA